MAKFKVGDKVRVRRDLVAGEEYGDYTFAIPMEKYKGRILTIDAVNHNSYLLKEVSYYWTDEMLGKVKEDINMEKTFEEVIRDIKKGEAWSDGFLKIEKIKDSIAIGSLNGKAFENIVGFVINPCSRFKLLRKEYTFEEAFKAYEEGKEIESCEGCRFKLTDKDNTLIIDYAGDEMEYRNKTELFSVKEIRGKWYIND